MNDKQILTLEAGKFYRTRDGRKAQVAGVNPFHDNAFCYVGWICGEGGNIGWKEGGKNGCNSNLDLVAEWVDPKRIKGWIAIGHQQNIHVPHFRTSNCFENAELAKQMFRSDYKVEPDACIEIHVLEGQGLKGEAA